MNVSSLRRGSLLLLVMLVIAGCWLFPIDRIAKTQVSAGLERALTAFAAARALGAVISVAQGTQLDVKPAGVGVSFAPGQVLQPLNELVDRFAAVMLAASVAFGIQLLLLSIGAHQAVSIALSAVVLVWVIVCWKDRRSAAARWMQPVLIGLLLVRFAAPVTGLASEAVYRGFMADDYRSALASIEPSPAAVTGHTPGAPTADDGFLDRIKRWSLRLPDLKAGYDTILKSASDWTKTIVQLIALFILQTAVFPLVFLWAVWRLAKATVRSGAPLPNPRG